MVKALSSARMSIHLDLWLDSPACPDCFPNNLDEGIKFDDAISDKDIEVVFDYPLSKQVTFTCKGPVTVESFITFVAETYYDIYEKEEETTKVRLEPSRLVEIGGQIKEMLNRNKTDGEYGIWGHVMGDLFLEGFEQQDGKYYLIMGS